jgi:hypothetical protein
MRAAEYIGVISMLFAKQIEVGKLLVEVEHVG